MAGSPATNSSPRLPGSARTKYLVAVLCALAVLIPSCTTSQSSSPPSSSLSTCRGVRVSPDRNLQALIDAKPPGTTFCFAKGLYRLSSGIWTGDKFPRLDLRAGAVIDGQNGGFVGINGPDGPANRPGTTILGGVFQHFGNANAEGAAPVVVRRNGVVVGTEFRENFNVGLGVQGSNARVSHVDTHHNGVGLGVQGSNARVSHVYTHHNGRYGLVVTRPCDGCPGPVGVIVEDSEIAFNNTRQLSVIDDAGGTKFSGGTVGMIVRGNEVHDNYGSGLWWDGFNRNAQVYGNVIRDNRNWGIFWELSYGGTKIHDNTLTGNGIGDGTANWYNNVQLLVSCSDGSVGRIEIYDNTIDGAAYPLGLINHSHHPLRTTGVYVHHNRMTLRSSGDEVGAVAFDGLTELFSEAANNRFDSNTYRVTDPGGAYWAWDGQMLTWSQWQALGHDQYGAVQAIP
jgi:Right handed beta helix region